MAISRAQLLKELLPGLNALFGLEYARYGEEHKEKKQNCLVSLLHLLKTKVLPSLMTMHKKLSQLVITTKLLPLALA